MNIDKKVTYLMQYKWKCKTLDVLMKAFTFLGDYCFIWIIFTILFYINGYRRYAYLMVATMLITNAINNGLIKSLFRRKRPFEVYEDITIDIPEPYGSSFPSGHSATGFCCAVIVGHFDPVLGILAYAIAALVAFSRLYLRVHFFSDIVVGSIVGIACSIFLLWCV